MRKWDNKSIRKMTNDNNSFTSKKRIRTIDTYRVIYFITTVFCFSVTEIGRFVYRPFIYENKIYDYGIADSIGNLGGIIVQIFFMLVILNPLKKYTFHVIAFIVVGYVLYEIAQPFLPYGVFDWKDIWGTLVGGVIAILYLLMLNKIIKNNKVIYIFEEKEKDHTTSNK